MILYNLSDLNNIKYQRFIIKYFYNFDMSLCKLDDKRIILLFWNNLYIFELPDKFYFESIHCTNKIITKTNDKINKNKRKKYS